MYKIIFLDFPNCGTVLSRVLRSNFLLNFISTIF